MDPLELQTIINNYRNTHGGGYVLSDNEVISRLIKEGLIKPEDAKNYSSGSIWGNGFVDEGNYGLVVEHTSPEPVVEEETQEKAKEIAEEINNAVGFWSDWGGERLNKTILEKVNKDNVLMVINEFSKLDNNTLFRAIGNQSTVSADSEIEMVIHIMNALFEFCEENMPDYDINVFKDQFNEIIQNSKNDYKNYSRSAVGAGSYKGLNKDEIAAIDNIISELNGEYKLRQDLKKDPPKEPEAESLEITLLYLSNMEIIQEMGLDPIDSLDLPEGMSFNSLEEAAEYLIKEKKVPETENDINKLAIKLLFLNSDGKEETIDDKVNNAIKNINSGSIKFPNANKDGYNDFIRDLRNCGFEKSVENLNVYQTIYAVLDAFNSAYEVNKEIIEKHWELIYSTLKEHPDDSEYLKKVLKEANCEPTDDFCNILISSYKYYPDKPESIKNNVLYETRKPLGYLGDTICKASINHPNDLDYLKKILLKDFGISLYSENEKELVQQMILQNFAAKLSSNVYSYTAGVESHLGNSGSTTYDIANLLYEYLDAELNEMGYDVTTPAELTELYKDTSRAWEYLTADKTSYDDFKKFFKDWFGTDFNEALARDFIEYCQQNPTADIYKDKVFREKFKNLFNSDFIEQMKLRHDGIKVLSTAGDILIMIFGMKAIGGLPFMQNFNMGAALFYENLGLTGTAFKVAMASTTGAANFAVYTAAERSLDNIVTGTSLDSEKWDEILPKALHSAAFGAFAGALHVLAISPMVEAKPVQEGFKAVTNALETGKSYTGNELMQIFYEAQEPVIKSSLGQGAYAFGVNAVGFTAYNISSDLITNGLDPLKNGNAGKYLGEVAYQNLINLLSFEAVKMIVGMQMAGNLGNNAANEYSIKDCLDEFVTMNNIECIQVFDANGNASYRIQTPKGLFTCDSPETVISLFINLMQQEIDYRNTMVETQFNASQPVNNSLPVVTQPPKSNNGNLVNPESVPTAAPVNNVVPIVPAESPKMLSQEEALTAIKGIFGTTPPPEASIESLLQTVFSEGNVPSEFVEIIKTLQQNSPNGFYDVKIALSAIFDNLNSLIEPSVENIKNLNSVVQLLSKNGLLEILKKPSDVLVKIIEIAKNADGNTDFSLVIELLQKNISFGEIQDILLNCYSYDANYKGHHDYDSYVKMLKIAEICCDANPSTRLVINKTLNDNHFANYEEFLKNPEPTIKYVTKCIEKKLIDPSDTNLMYWSFQFLPIPASEIQLEVFSKILDTTDGDAYKLKAFSNYVKNINEENKDFFINALINLGNKTGIPNEQFIFGKDLLSFDLYYYLDSITESYEGYYKNASPKIQSIINQASIKGIYIWSNQFLNALKIYPEEINKIIEIDSLAKNVNWSLVLDFLGGSKGDLAKIPEEQLDNFLELVKTYNELSNDNYYLFVKPNEKRNTVIEFPKEYHDFVKYIITITGENPINLMEIINKIYKESPAQLETVKTYLEQNPQIIKLYSDNLSIVFENLDAVKAIVPHEEILESLYAVDKTLISSLFEDFDFDIVKSCLEQMDTSSLRNEIKQKFPKALGYLFMFKIAETVEMNVQLNINTMFESFMKMIYILDKYDEQYARIIFDIGVSCFDHNQSSIKLYNIDFAVDYIKEYGETNELKKILNIDFDFSALLKYAKELNLNKEETRDFIEDMVDIIEVYQHPEYLKLNEKIEWYNKLLNFDAKTKELCLKSGINIDNLMIKLNALVNNIRPTIKIPIEDQQLFIQNIIANNNPQVETVLKTFDFAQFGKEGLPLKYPRTRFNNNIEILLNTLPENDQLLILEHFGLTRGESGFDGLPNNKPFENENASEEVKNVADKVLKEIEAFSINNSLITGDHEVDKILTGLVQGFPEFTFIVGKEQHGTHAYSVDIHTLKVLQSAMNDPMYEKLNDLDKTILKFTALMHDFGKKGGVVDAGHAELSADFATSILKKFSLPEGIKDRIIDIIEDHHWFEAYNKGQITAEDVAIHCRRPEDFKIYSILAKADFQNVNSSFHLEISGVKTQEAFNQFMDGKLSDIQKALTYLYSNTNLVYDTKFVRKGELFPRETAQINNRTVTFKVLNLNNIDNNADLAKYGFASGVTKEDSRYIIHATDPDFSCMDPVMILTSNSMNKSSWSVSLIKVSNNRTYCHQQFGFIFDVDQANIGEAYYENLGSGYAKTINDYKNIVFDQVGEIRTFVRDKFLTELKNKGIELTEEEYGVLAQSILNKKYTAQLNKDVTIGDKTIKTEDLIACLEASREYLFDGGNIHSELVVVNPRVIGLFAKVENLSDCPKEFLLFAEKYDLPIIIMRPTDK